MKEFYKKILEQNGNALVTIYQLSINKIKKLKNLVATKEDGDSSESNSIASQRQIIESFAKNNDITIASKSNMFCLWRKYRQESSKYKRVDLSIL